MSTKTNQLEVGTSGLIGYNASTFDSTAVVAHNILIGGATNDIVVNVAPSATSGIPLVSNGTLADPSFTTATVAGGGTGRTTLTNHGILVGATTAAITQLATGSAGQILQSGGASADPAYSTPTYPSTSGTSGKILVSDGTNNVYSTPTFPNASATARKIIVSDGTNWVASTETYAVPGTSGNVMTSNGTNWTSAAVSSPAASCAFFVYKSAGVLNVTGTGTVYTISFDTKLYDLGSNFSVNTFTAPSTGKYFLSANVGFNYFGGGESSQTIYITTTSKTYQIGTSAVGASTINILANMTAGDTAIIQASSSGGAVNDVGISGSGIETAFYGYKVI